MSLIEHAVDRLRKAFTTAQREGAQLHKQPLAGGNSLDPSPLLEQLEPRLHLSTTIFTEDFESHADFQNDWTTNIHQNRQWFTMDTKPYNGSRSAFSSTQRMSDKTYVNNQENYMRHYEDLSDYDTAVLTFRYWMNTETRYDGMRVNIEGNTEWVETGPKKQWLQATVDISDYCGNRHNVQVLQR